MLNDMCMLIRNRMPVVVLGIKHEKNRVNILLHKETGQVVRITVVSTTLGFFVVVEGRSIHVVVQLCGCMVKGCARSGLYMVVG